MSTSAKRLASKAAILIVCGLAAFAAGAIVVHAATSSQAAKKPVRSKAKPSFKIRTQLSEQLSPGQTVPLKISFSNTRTKDIWLLRFALRLTLDKAHVAAGCSLRRDYRVVQLPKKFFPYKIPKAKVVKGKKKIRLKYRTIPARKANGKPALVMLSPPGVNQDACKGATLTLSYITRSTSKKPRKLRKKVSTR